jgi:type IX secretion system PorP/SprF family membrane protein
MYKKHLPVVAGLLVLYMTAGAQDPHFSQSASSPMMVNPGFAGSTGTWRVDAAYRNQWPKLDGNYGDYTIGADGYINCLSAGVGINFLNDNAGQGTIKTNRVDFIWAQQIHLLHKKLTLVPSLDAAYIQKTVDFSKLTFASGLPPEQNNTIQAMDISAGLLLYSKDLCAGFSIFHLNTPDLGIFGPSKLPCRYSVNLSYTFHLNRENGLTLTPTLRRYYQDATSDFVYALLLGYKNIRLGIGYRSNDALIGMLGFHNNRFSVSYSYDYTTSSLTNAASGGAHELLVQVNLFTKHKAEDFLSCPEMF